jgi:hypothetical protein
MSGKGYQIRNLTKIQVRLRTRWEVPISFLYQLFRLNFAAVEAQAEADFGNYTQARQQAAEPRRVLQHLDKPS